MGKLKLKRTPEEQAAHDARKARKAARKASRARPLLDDDDEDPYASHSSSSHKRRRTQAPEFNSTHDFVFDEDELYGPEPSSSYAPREPDYEQIRAQVEEQRFREKMWGAFEEDERLDGVEASMNSYAHIPRRWRGGGMDRMDDEDGIDPQLMEDEDYTEWVRAGMWRKKHAAEFAEQERKKAERAARKEREEAMHAETRRMEKEEDQRRRQRHSEKERKRWSEARARYESKWKELLATVADSEATETENELRFDDIPWPVLVLDIGPTPDRKGKGRALDVRIDIEDLTVDGVSAFLLPGGRPAESVTALEDAETIKKERRDKLRETMLRFHPDKFEGRVMRRVREKDKEVVREGVGRITRAINELLAGKG